MNGDSHETNFVNYQKMTTFDRESRVLEKKGHSWNCLIRLDEGKFYRGECNLVGTPDGYGVMYSKRFDV